MKRYRIILYLGVGILLFLLVNSLLTLFPAKGRHSSDEAVILVEQVKQVTKLIAVEAMISEIYEHKDFWAYDIAPLRKKALVRVKAKVSVGYDLEEMEIITLPEERKLIVKFPARPEILSIDHQLDYYDLTEGWLNSFDEKALSNLQLKARDFIEKKVHESSLYEEAEAQKNQWFESLDEIISLSGWQLELQSNGNANKFKG